MCALVHREVIDSHSKTENINDKPFSSTLIYVAQFTHTQRNASGSARTAHSHQQTGR